MTDTVRRICVTGPESTGKTTLAARLAESLATDWVPEASRRYAERVARNLTMADVEPIAREHVALADAAAEGERARESGLLLLDTDLVSTAVYGRFYYGFASPWIDEQARARLADIYLLSDVDVPWVADGIRDRPADRDGMFTLFADALVERGAHAVVIRGDWAARWDAALAAVRTPAAR